MSGIGQSRSPHSLYFYLYPVVELETKGFHLMRDVNVKSVPVIFLIQEGRKIFFCPKQQNRMTEKLTFGFIFNQQLLT